jgi:hypothetical protein
MSDQIFFNEKWHDCHISRHKEKPIHIPGPLGSEYTQPPRDKLNAKIALPVDGEQLPPDKYEVIFNGQAYTFDLQRPYGTEALGFLTEKS